MSLIGSLLALVAIPLRAKIKERPKEVDNLTAMALADEVRRLQFALDHWRNAGTALMEENERLRAELQDASCYRRHTDRQRYDQNVALAQQMLAQQQLQHQSYQGLGQLQQGMANVASQNLYDDQHAIQNYAGCTCVPARADAIRGTMFER